MIERSEPITTKINQIIRDRVKTGTYRLGSRLPSELALAIEFGVSRSTLRNAVNSLVTDGVIIRKHGNGSYINPHAFQFNTQLQNLWSFPQLIQESGRVPDIRFIKGSKRLSSELEQVTMELDSPQPVYVLERLFMADGIPAIYSTNIIPSALFSSTDQPLDTQLTIYEFLMEYCRLELIYSISELHIKVVTDQVNEFLKIGTGRSVLFFNDVFYTKESRPVVIGQNYYNDQILNLRFFRSKA